MLPFRGKSDSDTRVLTGNEVFEFCQENNLLFLDMIEEKEEKEVKTKNIYPFILLSSVVDGKEHHALFHLDDQNKVDFIKRGFTPSVLQSPVFWEKLCECEEQCSDIFYGDSEKSLIAINNDYTSYCCNFPCDPFIRKMSLFFGFFLSLLPSFWIMGMGKEITSNLIWSSFIILFPSILFYCLSEYRCFGEIKGYKKVIELTTLKYLSDSRNISIPQKFFLEARLSCNKDMEKAFSKKRRYFGLNNDFLMYLSGLSNIKSEQTDFLSMDTDALEAIISDMKEIHGEASKIAHHLDCIRAICLQINSIFLSHPNSDVKNFLSEVFQKATPIWKEYANLSSLSKNDAMEAHVLDFTESILGHLSSIQDDFIKASYEKLEEKIKTAKMEIMMKFLETKNNISCHPLLLPEPQAMSSKTPIPVSLDVIPEMKKKEVVYV